MNQIETFIANLTIHNYPTLFQHRPSKPENYFPAPTFGQFSSNQGFIVPTTEGPREEKKEQKNEDLAGVEGLYREDVLKKPLHNKKTRHHSQSNSIEQSIQNNTKNFVFPDEKQT